MKTVLITGASSGFGKATAKLLAKHGYKLILIARRKEILEKLKQSLKTKIYIAAVDVTNKDQVKELFETLPKEFQDIDVLINNAGLALGMGTVLDADLEDWEKMVDTNIKGLLYVTRFALDKLKKKNKRSLKSSQGSDYKGLIINIGSVAGSVPYKGGNVYGATKAFVKQFSRNLRTDLLGTDIKVTNIAPGRAETEFSIVRFKGDIEKAKKEYENMRAITPEDIANTILWVINQPDRINIDYIEVMPIDQTYAGLAIHRR